MARYVKTPDIWNMSDDERRALQPGQFVRCGDAPYLSRFYAIRDNGHVVAFHGPNASRKLMEYVRNV